MSVNRTVLFAGLLLFTWSFALRGDDTEPKKAEEPKAEEPKAVETTERFDEAVLKAEGIKTDGPALLEYFKKMTLSEDERAKLADTVRRLGHDDFATREKASADLLAAGRSAMPFLRQGLKDPDLEVALRSKRCLDEIESTGKTALTISAARLLGMRKPEGAALVLLNYLPFAEDDFIEEELLATLASVGLSGGKADPALVDSLKDKLPLRRSAAALILGRSADADHRKAVKELLEDKDHKVRLRAARGLVDGKEKDGVKALVDLILDAPMQTATLAEETLCRIAGEQSPQISVAAHAEERKKCHEAWSGWWKDNEGKIDLAKLDLEKRLLGLTLIVQYNSNNGAGGKVFECGPDGKVRWEITDAQGPIHAQVLPGNRVLIAEHTARRITERDFKGKILWEFPLNDPNNQFHPVSCQRLPNGNTFIGAYPNKIMEVTPDKKEVYSHILNRQQFYHARKLPNGQIACATANGSMVLLDEKGKELKTVNAGRNSGWNTVEDIPGGRFLVLANPNVVEMDATGKVLTTYKNAGAQAASKLANGNILICNQQEQSVKELDKTGKVIWKQGLDGLPYWAKRR